MIYWRSALRLRQILFRHGSHMQEGDRNVEKQSAPTRRSVDAWPLVVLAVVVVVGVVARVRLLDVPLERDEGEFAYIGQLILQGTPPYGEAYNMKFPGTYFIYALAMAVLGQTPVGIHSALLAANLATAVFIYLLAGRLFDRWSATAATACFIVLSLSLPFYGFWAHAEHFLILAVTGGLYTLVCAVESGRRWQFLLSGLILGLAVVIRQHGVFFAAFAGVSTAAMCLMKRSLRWRGAAARIGLFVLGVVVPCGLTCLYLAAAGVFRNFFFWTITYASEYVSMTPWSEGERRLVQMLGHIAGPNFTIVGLSLLGFVALFSTKIGRRRWAFVTGLAVLSFLAVCPGFYFRPHYFIYLLPPMSLLAGVAVGAAAHQLSQQASQASRPWLVALLILGVVGVPVFVQRNVLFVYPLERVVRVTFSGEGIQFIDHPFTESIPIADYIRTHSSPDERIAVVGSEPQIYFYSRRRAATGYVYTYALMEDHPYAHQMQMEMIAQIREAEPEYIVYVHVKTSWLRRPQSETTILEWVERHVAARYTPVGFVDIVSDSETVYRWDEDALHYTPRSGLWVGVYRKKHS